jgi:NADH-quinone oxidoreductase subunit E
MSKGIFPPEIENQLEHWLAKYPEDQRQSAVIPGLHIIQEYNGGHLTTELMDKLAEYIGMPRISVYEVATFYSMYHHEPVGRHVISLCTNISCMLNGAEKISAHIQNKLGIRPGETTSDGRITLKIVECMGACCGAPMLEVDKVYHENLTFEKVDQLLDALE